MCVATFYKNNASTARRTVRKKREGGAGREKEGKEWGVSHKKEEIPHKN
jgi:hypothetical protein